MTEEYENRPVVTTPQAGQPLSQNLDVIMYMSEAEEQINRETGEVISKVDPDLARWFWGFVQKDVIWAKLSEVQIRAKKHAFLAARSGYLMNIPPDGITEKMLHDLDNLEEYYFTRLERGRDGWERQKMTEMTTQTLYGEVRPPGSQPQRQGLFQRGMNMFFGGGR